VLPKAKEVTYMAKITIEELFYGDKYGVMGVQQKRIFAVQISGKYIVPKSALVEFLVDDFAFEIVHKSTWHMNTILMFVEGE
jgi:hypothetical protein